MTLSQSALADGLETLTPTQSEATGIQRFTDAFRTYFEGATVDGIVAVPATLVAPANAMAAAMVGVSASGAGAAKIQAGIVAFWASVAAAAATVWPGHGPVVISATVPPGLAGLAAALTTVFAANVTARASLADASAAIAAVIHPLQLGGIAAVGPPAATFPIT